MHHILQNNLALSSGAPFIIPPHVVACWIACQCRARMRASAASAAPRAGMRFGTGAARGAGTLFSSMPAQSSGQAWAK